MSVTTSVGPDQADAQATGDAANQPGGPRRWLLLGGAAGATALVAGLLLTSPVLGVKQIEVTGNSGVPAEEVVSASGIAQGAPLLRVNTAAAAERVGQLESVQSATVDRKWPNAVVISVVPETAVAYTPDGEQWDVWGAGGGRLAVVDEEPADLPLLQQVPEQSRAEALAVIGSLPAQVRAQVAEVDLQEGRGYLLELNDGAGTVRWGDAGQSELKATVLAAMMTAAPDAKWFDVSAPTAPRSAVAEPARVPRTGPSPTPSGTAAPEGEADDTTADTSDPADAADPADAGQQQPPVPTDSGGGESPLGLQPQ